MYANSLNFKNISILDVCNIPVGDVLIITSTSRQTNRVRNYIIEQIKQVKKTKELYKILPLNSWITETFDKLFFYSSNSVHECVFNHVCEQIIWDKVIKREESENYLVNYDQAASLAMKAKKLIIDMKLRIPNEFTNDEYERFSLWKKRYYKELRKLKAIDFDGVYDHVLEAFKNNKIVSPKYLIVFGFIEFSPRLIALLNSFLKNKTSVRLLSLSSRTVDNNYINTVCECSSFQQEWEQASLWIIEQISYKPKGVYAIIVPQLELKMPLVQRMAERYLNKYLLPFGFNISSSRSCLDWPIIDAAISWLKVVSSLSFYGYCDVVVLGKALLSGYVVDDIRLFARYSSVDLVLRSKYKKQIKLKEILEELGQCNLSQDLLVSVSRFGRELLSIDCWVSRIRLVLNDLAFPGERMLDSSAYQSLEAFEELFGDFLLLTTVFGKVTSVEVVKLFSDFVKKIFFQPKDNVLSRLEILDIEDSYGGSWDAVWVLGMNEDVFPFPPNQNPFVPSSILRSSNISRFTPEGQLFFSQKIYKSIIEGSAKIIFSYSVILDSQKSSLSSLISQNYYLMDVVNYKKRINKVDIEFINDEKGPVLDTENINKNTSVNILELQSRNPLWSFVRYRLGACRLKSYNDSDDYNSKRGILIHYTLEKFWSLAKDKSFLEKTSSVDLDILLNQCISEIYQNELIFYGEALCKLEMERTFYLLKKMLSIDILRKDFEVISTESEFVWEYKKLFLKIRVDRIDLLSNKKIAVIDYKTGKTIFSPEKDWNRERPVNLQVPFYSLVCKSYFDLDISSLIMIFLNSKEITIKGISDVDVGLSNIYVMHKFDDNQLWKSFILNLHKKILLIAEEYVNGEAYNKFSSPEDSMFCDVMPFLRLGLDEL
ncbi:RecB family exonuclease [Candidatus Kinetoplastibacterium desouzaii TCC079E]|uniref:RecB family exonuclease n=1 Tax=Candidatus Kinetoplastidibacterium desouzai TCC079E TaxID=1208919 RepID=M1LRA7_9PROT|nr:PD-(D/E)XK nuclease family protein [Candidatus Kinetoplastibacterium desouzaii]AGF46691.1 RecB family exonuclease [Candidatus Kinetoplastibacterium desouzaii TCC079E]